MEQKVHDLRSLISKVLLFAGNIHLGKLHKDDYGYSYL